MCKLFGVMLAAVVLATAATASAQQPQDSPQQSPAPQPDAQSTILHTSTHLVVVDVSVQDRDGHPVHNLKPEDFHLSEGKVPQNIRHFEEHSALAPVPRGPQLPQLPPGTFTDYTPVTPNGTLNILLLDALNTPTTDQNFVRYELQQYVKHADPGTRIAIFGLANRLIMLQGFTSDPATLKDVVEHKLIARASSLLNDPTGSGVNQDSPSDVVESTMAGPGASQLAANMQEFETDAANMQTQLRMQFTLDAFNTLAHYLASFPGRKNLIWFSGSFPLNILPDPSLDNPFAVAHLNEDEYRETTNLLAKAQVAVYPIDARGLKVPPTYNAAASGRSYSSNPQKFSAALTNFYSSQAAEHSTMDTLASETGGKAYFNTNDLASSVEQAMDAGANYYTLTYSPLNRKEDGSYREIRVDLNGAATRDLQLSYRRGYYADDARSHDKDAESATTSEAAISSHGQTTAYQRAAMSRGAPTPQDLLFKVRVLPASTAIEKTVAPANRLDASVSPTGPFRRYAVDYVALPSELTLSLQPDGRREGAIEFLVYVFDVDGKLLNATGKTVSLNLTPTTYARLMKSAIECHLEISAPTGAETFLRVGVRDVPSNHFGVIEVATASVSRLAPPVYPAPPSAAKASSTSTNAPSN
ncbi:MAG: VWA domain-containing protein [Acidobacteriaceae bacterium]